MAPCSSLILLMFEKEIRLCFVAPWLGVSGMVFFLDGFVTRFFLVGFVGRRMVMVFFLGEGECTFHPLVEIRESPEIHDLMRADKAHWPRCLLWHGWLPMLSGVNGASPWFADASATAAYLVEVALGRYSPGLVAEWNPSDDFDHDVAVSSLPDHPDVWTDGSLVLGQLTGIFLQVLGFLLNSRTLLEGRRWGSC